MLSASADPTSGSIRSIVSVPGAGLITQKGLRVNVYENVRVTASAPVCASSATPTKAGPVTLTCTPNAATAALLRNGSVRVYLTFVFTPTDGAAVKATTRVVVPKLASAKPTPPVTG